MRKPRVPADGQTRVDEPMSAPPNRKYGDGYMEPLPILEELHPWPISLLAAFADCGTVLSGSRAIGGAHEETSDFDLYQTADKSALVQLLHVLSFAKIKWHNLLLSQVMEEVAEFGLAMIPLERLKDLWKHVSVEPGPMVEGVEDYLEDALKQEGLYEKYRDLPHTFALALAWVHNNSADNRLWIYKPEDDSTNCIRPLPSTTTSSFSKLFKWLPSCDIATAGNAAQTKDARNPMPKVPDYRKWIPSSKSIAKVKKAWEAKGYPKQMLRRWLHYKMIKLAPWLTGEVDTILNRILRVNPTDPPPTDARTQLKKHYPWFKMLRGTLPSGKKVQLMLITPKRNDGRRKYGVVGTLFDFYATHCMAGISGVVGFHLYHGPTSKGVSWKVDFTKDSRQKHANEGIAKMTERGFKFEDMDDHDKRRAVLDKKTTLWTEYKTIYESALRDVGKGDEDRPSWWNTYFDERLCAFETYTWREQHRRIKEVTNTTQGETTWSPTYDTLFKWVNDNLSDHKDVIPKDYICRERIMAELDLLFGGFQHDWKDDLCHLL